MHLTIKTRNLEIFYSFYQTITRRNWKDQRPIDKILFDTIFYGGVEISFYTNGTIYFKGIINANLDKLINDHLVDKKFYVGTDEVGVGEGVGPLVVCSLVFDSLQQKEQAYRLSIKDSKKLDAKKVDLIATQLMKISNYHCEIIEPIRLNKIYKEISNLKAINALAQNELIKKFDPKMTKVTDAFVSLDKFKEYISTYKKTIAPGEIIFETKAEEKYFEVACAAIIAKKKYNDWLINFCKTNHVSLTIGKKVQAQKLYLDIRYGKTSIPDELRESLLKTFFK